MAKLYAEFGIEVYEKSILNDCIQVMQMLGNIDIIETRRKTVIINYKTKPRDVFELEDISNELCGIIEPFRKKIQNFFSKFNDKLYADICFVNQSDEKNVTLKLNKRLINLASNINVEINFDGF